MKKVLVVVDCQYDFCSEDGTLYVPGAEIAVENIANFIKSNEFDKIWFTIDWHCKNHPSFVEFGGQWPHHCIQHSSGAAIMDILLDVCYDENIDYWTKGEWNEEYAAFNDIDPFSIFNDDTEVIVCGVAGDYCVKETIKNLLPCNPKIYLDGIASIDDGTIINDFIKENKLIVI